MKMKFWSVYVTMISTSLLAQEASPHSPYVQQESNAPSISNAPTAVIETPPASPAVTAAAPGPTNPPAARPAKKKAAARKPRHAAPAAAELKTVPLIPGPAVVAADHVNVRGQARLRGEILTRLTNGEPVTVIEEVELKHSGPEEPSVWAKIALPQKVRVWVYASYIDPTNKTVISKKLNLRGGPGENYSVLGTLQRGEAVKGIETKGKWMEIEPPAGAYAFMAAQYLKQEPAALAAATPAAPTTVTEAPSAAETTTEIMPGTNEIAAATTNEIAAPAPAVEEPLPPRIVQREGIVRYTASIQAPTLFELVSPDSHKPIDYLYTTSPNLDLNRYKGLHIIVTGEEGLDERWKLTPIITIQRIQVIE
jgi:uncharacterized protein YgiM (DUF1202 family)